MLSTTVYDVPGPERTFTSLPLDVNTVPHQGEFAAGDVAVYA